MDYILAALDGSKSNEYVSNSYDCGLNGRYFAIDVRRTITNSLTEDTSSLSGVEDVVFNATATMSGYLPDTIYYCYFVPRRTYVAWNKHYKQFDSLDDFEGGFIQNIMGNFLTFIDVYENVETAAESGDYVTVVG